MAVCLAFLVLCSLLLKLSIKEPFKRSLLLLTKKSALKNTVMRSFENAGKEAGTG